MSLAGHHHTDELDAHNKGIRMRTSPSSSSHSSRWPTVAVRQQRLANTIICLLFRYVSLRAARLAQSTLTHRKILYIGFGSGLGKNLNFRPSPVSLKKKNGDRKVTFKMLLEMRLLKLQKAVDFLGLTRQSLLQSILTVSILVLLAAFGINDADRVRQTAYSAWQMNT